MAPLIRKKLQEDTITQAVRGLIIQEPTTLVSHDHCVKWWFEKDPIRIVILAFTVAVDEIVSFAMKKEIL